MLQKVLRLPNGTILKNRLAKSAMSENLSTRDHAPSDVLIEAYNIWAMGGAGLLITGNVMVSENALGEPRNVVVQDERHFNKLKKWASVVNNKDVHLWVQINHPGRQAMEQINKNLYAPSAVPLKMGGRKNASKKIPKALEESQINEIIQQFAQTAEVLKKAGFTGVQIHGAHGYLVSQFLSPLTNVREDKWGGSIQNRARFVVEVIRAIRERVGAAFPIGIKLNSADFQKGGFSEEDSMEVIKIIAKEGIDLIEISGGTYEAPAMMGRRKKSTREREAYFIDYVERARKVTEVPLMLTGGFRSVEAMEAALNSEALDVVGLARPFCVYPELPKEVFNGVSRTFPTNFKRTGVKMIDAVMSLIWYEAQIKRLGQGKAPKPNLSPWWVFAQYVGLIVQRKFFK